MIFKHNVCMYVFILQQDNTQNIKPEGQQGSEALTAARNKKMFYDSVCLKGPRGSVPVFVYQTVAVADLTHKATRPLTTRAPLSKAPPTKKTKQNSAPGPLAMTPAFRFLFLYDWSPAQSSVCAFDWHQGR